MEPSGYLNAWCEAGVSPIGGRRKNVSNDIMTLSAPNLICSAMNFLPVNFSYWIPQAFVSTPHQRGPDNYMYYISV